MLVEGVVNDRDGHRHLGFARRKRHCPAALHVVDIDRGHAVHVVRRRHVARRPVHADRQCARGVQSDLEGQRAIGFRSVRVSDRHGRRVVIVHNGAGGHSIVDRRVARVAEHHREHLVVLVEGVVNDRDGHRHLGFARCELSRAGTPGVVDVDHGHAIHVVGRLHIPGCPFHADRQAARSAQGHGEGHFTVHLRSAAVGNRHSRRIIVVHDRTGRHAVPDHHVVGHLRRQHHAEHLVVLVEHVVGDGDGNHPRDRSGHASCFRHEIDRGSGTNGRVVHVGSRHTVRVVRRLHVARHHVQDDGQATGRVERDGEDQIFTLVATHVGDHHRGRLVVVLDRTGRHLAFGYCHVVRHLRTDRDHERFIVLVEHVVGDRYGHGVLSLAHHAGCGRIGRHEDHGTAHGHIVGVRDRLVVHPGGLVIPGGPVNRDLLAAGIVQADREYDLLGSFVSRRSRDRGGRRIVVVHDGRHGHVAGCIDRSIARCEHVDHFRRDRAAVFVEHVVVGRDGQLCHLLARLEVHRHGCFADGRSRFRDRHHHRHVEGRLEPLRTAQGPEEPVQREHNVVTLGRRLGVRGDRNLDIRADRCR